jgi:hypothetical protein
MHRTTLFWLVCIPTRVALSEAARRGYQLVRLFAAVVSYRWLTGLEDSSVGVFGGVAWWAHLRRTHGLLWGLYALTDDYRFLVTDTMFGALSAAGRSRLTSSST